MSKDEWEKEQYGVVNDLKLGFRHEQIESEGNDPSVTGESFGTPHDLATISQQGNGEEPQFENEMPDGGWPGSGRPKKSNTYGTDKSPFGRDPLGNKGINVKPESYKHSYKANSVLNNESTEAMLSKMNVKVKTKEIITESLKNNEEITEVDMLDEKNILNSDN